MKNIITTLLFLFVLVVLTSSCGTTVYRGRVYKSKKYIGYKQHWYKWHAHYYRPRQHAGGYW
jgi:hypothetical protein